MNRTYLEKIIASALMLCFFVSATLFPFFEAKAIWDIGDESEIDPTNYLGQTTSNTNTQTNTGTTTAEDTDTGENPYAFNVTNIEEAIPAVLGCTGLVSKVKGALNDLIDPEKAADFVNSLDDNDYINQTEDALEGIGQEATSVPTDNAALEKKTSEIKKKEDQIKKEAENAKFREECINGVAYSLAKNQLKSITEKTVNWINSGFNGDPLFVRDQDSYFDSLGKETLRSFLGPIVDFDNASLYPYGRDFAKALIKDKTTDPKNKLISNLNNSLQNGSTTEDFAQDFNKGGWDGWFSLTQNPANNPLGFNILATQQVADEQNKKVENAKSELAQNNGFLDQKKCVEYAKGTPDTNATNNTPSATGDIKVLSKSTGVGLLNKTIGGKSFTLNMQYDAPSAGTITAELQNLGGGREDSKTVMTIGQKGKVMFDVSFNGLLEGSYHKVEVSFSTGATAGIASFEIYLANSQNKKVSTGEKTQTQECLRYETVTPGTIIQDQLKTQLQSPTRQLELADTVNESLDAVFGALMNQLINQGLSSLATFNPKNSSNNGLGGPGSNKIYDASGNDISNIPGVDSATGKIITVGRGRGWTSADKFDITTALGDIMRIDPVTKKKYVYKKGIITIQKDYIEAVNNSLKVLPGILPAIGELDYCIPGPNPTWQGPARVTANALIEQIRNTYLTQDFKIVKPNFKSSLLKTTNGMDLIQNPDSWYIQAADSFANIIESIPILGGLYKLQSSLIGSVYDLLSTIGGGSTRQEKIDKAKADLKAQQDQAREDFETGKKAAIRKIKNDFTTYSNKMTELYGPNSLMRTAYNDDGTDNQFYLPMAEAGLDVTRNLRTYEINIASAKTDYAEEVRKAKANIYRLGIIKAKVDAIVKAARKRQQNDIIYGKIKVPAECLDAMANQDATIESLNGVKTNNTTTTGPGNYTNYTTGGNNTGNTNNTTGNNNTANGAGNYTNNTNAALTADFSIIQESYANKCTTEITLNNISTGGTTPYTTEWKLTLGSGKIITQSSFNSYPISQSKDSGTATIEMKVKDKKGSVEFESKAINIIKRTQTPSGAVCPN